MGTLELSFDGRTRTLPLWAVNSIGRHSGCTHTLLDAAVPLFWLEVRHTAEGWCWRPLEGHGHTRGSGRHLLDGWRSFDTGGTRPHRIHCGRAGSVQIADPSPPSLFAQNLRTGEIIGPSELKRVLEFHGGKVYEQGQGADPTNALSCGAVFVAAQQAFCLSLGTQQLPTITGTLKLSAEGVQLDLDPATLTLRLTHDRREVEVTGGCVRVLVPYARARLEDDWAEGGWLNLEEAHQAWIASGGRPTSGSERLGWEKGRLRTKLADAGCIGVADLFEKRRMDDKWWARLTLPPARITIAE
jgi:hypothetical protein